MMVVYALLFVIGVLALLLGASLVVIWKLVTHLSDKIAIPLYDQASKRTIIARPDPAKPTVIQPEDQNLPDKVNESHYEEVDQVDPDELYNAIARSNG